MQPFSPAQVAGYIALGLGISAFLQKRDARLKLLIATQSLVYGIHFVMLGNFPACASATLSSVRSFLAMRSRSRLLGAFAVAGFIVLGLMFAKTPAGWLPVAGSCVGTIAFFTLEGIPFRVVLLASTLMWLANNVIAGSIGGTILEVANIAINLSTIVRMVRDSAAQAELAPAGD
jgi:hypothetical protein